MKLFSQNKLKVFHVWIHRFQIPASIPKPRHLPSRQINDDPNLFQAYKIDSMRKPFFFSDFNFTLEHSAIKMRSL